MALVRVQFTLKTVNRSTSVANPDVVDSVMVDTDFAGLSAIDWAGYYFTVLMSPKQRLITTELWVNSTQFFISRGPADPDSVTTAISDEEACFGAAIRAAP
jgi:hypothetical protein